MDKMLAALLRGLGIQIAPEALAEIEALLPRIPGIVRKVWDTLNLHFVETEQRLAALEQEVRKLNGRNEPFATGVTGNNRGSDTPGGIEQLEREA